MVELTPKALGLSAIGCVITALVSGYVFSIGADLWQLTKQSLGLSTVSTLFWGVSVPLGVLGIVLAVFAIMKSRHKPAQTILGETSPLVKPDVELTTLPPETVPHDLMQSNTLVIVESKRQSLSVKSVNYSETLAANIWVGKDVGTTHLGWGTPTIIVETGQAELSKTKKWRKFLGGETQELPIWYAYTAIVQRQRQTFTVTMDLTKRNKPVTEEYQVFLNTVPSTRLLKPEDIDRGYVNLTIKFAGIGIDKKPLKYRLNLRPWNEIGLEQLS